MVYVAPLVGAWIEILAIAVDGEPLQSLLSWERGLKCTLITEYWLVKKSLLSWERGLKWLVAFALFRKEHTSLLSWERGLKF